MAAQAAMVTTMVGITAMIAPGWAIRAPAMGTAPAMKAPAVATWALAMAIAPVMVTPVRPAAVQRVAAMGTTMTTVRWIMAATAPAAGAWNHGERAGYNDRAIEALADPLAAGLASPRKKGRRARGAAQPRARR